jgi:ParB family chromosome partitioning protein
VTKDSIVPAQTGSINAGISSLVRSRVAAAAAAPPSTTRQILLDDIVPSPYQPPGRRAPTDEEVLALADDMLIRKQLMNVVVRPRGAQFELMAGERRWRACQLNRARVSPDRRAEWETIRADVREASDVDAADIVAVENLQREQLSDLDEAFTYAQLMDLHQFTQAKQLADHLKRPVRTIQRLLQIHRAPDFIKDAMMKGLLVEAAQGEAVAKTHRRLDKEPALVFLRLYEVFGRQRDPGLQREADEAREALTQARTAVTEGSDEDAKDATRKRLDKAHALAERAARRVIREAERRAEARVGGAIERALREDWSLRHVETFYKSYADAPAPGGVPPAPSDRPTPAAGSAERGVLFAEDGHRLVVHRDRFTSAGADEKARLAGVLRAVLEQLQPERAGSEVEAVSSVSADAA